MTRGVRHKVLAGVSLVVLAIVSFVLSYAHLGHASLPVALGIASVKAGLVVLVFMEVGEESTSFKLALLAAVFLIALMLGLVAADVGLRGTPPLAPELPPTPAEAPGALGER